MFDKLTAVSYRMTQMNRAEYVRSWRLRHPDRDKAARVAYQKKRSARNLEIVQEARSGACADCSRHLEGNMEFDHRDPSTKEFSIGGRKYGVGLARLLAEIAKCDVVCVECHKRRTKERRSAVNNQSTEALV